MSKVAHLKALMGQVSSSGRRLQTIDAIKLRLPRKYHGPHKVRIMRGYMSSTSPLMLSSRGSVNLIPSIPLDTLKSIQALPEASQALDVLLHDQMQPTTETIDCLKRANDIFEQFSPKGDEIRSILILQSQAFSELEMYRDAIKVLDSLLQMELDEEQFYNVSLAKIKMLWLDGSFQEAIQIADELCDLAPQMESHKVQLYQGVALNALSICRLSLLDLKDADMISLRKNKGKDIESSLQVPSDQLQEVDEVKAILQMASSILRSAYQQNRGGQNQQNIQLGLAAAVSFANQGVSELIYVLIKSQHMGMQLPYDQALNAFREALNILDKFESDINKKQAAFLKATRARIYSNMAWAILFTSSYTNKEVDGTQISEDSLKLASEYAGHALKIHDEMAKENDGEKNDKYHSMSRSLSLVASCYARAGSAVTAEGLFHSAMDSSGASSSNPMCMLETRSSLVYYSQLCGNWEKRGSDCNMNEDLAIEKDGKLSPSWRGKSSLYSGAFFISMGDL